MEPATTSQCSARIPVSSLKMEDLQVRMEKEILVHNIIFTLSDDLFCFGDGDLDSECFVIILTRKDFNLFKL